MAASSSVVRVRVAGMLSISLLLQLLLLFAVRGILVFLQTRVDGRLRAVDCIVTERINDSVARQAVVTEQTMQGRVSVFLSCAGGKAVVLRVRL